MATLAFEAARKTSKTNDEKDREDLAEKCRAAVQNSSTRYSHTFSPGEGAEPRHQNRKGQETLHPRGGTPANNPLACFVGFSGGERTPLPRHQEAKETTKEVRRVSHPFHVSDHRGAFPVAEVAEADLSWQRLLAGSAGTHVARVSP